MQWNIFDQQLEVLALHLGATELQALQLKTEGSSLIIKAYGSCPLPKDTLTADAIVAPDVLAKTISELVARPAFGAFTTKLVAVSIPESKSFIRVIQIPVMPKKEIENAILFEVEGYIPLPIEQVYFDWQIVRTIENHLEVLVIAAPKEFIDSYIAVLEQAGLEPAAIETESQSLQRALLPADSLQTTLVVDFDTQRTNLVMIEQGALQFTSSIPAAPRDAANTAVPAVSLAQSIAPEIQNIMQFHYDHSVQKIDSIILSGTVRGLPQLAEDLKKQLPSGEECAVLVADPLAQIPDLKKSPLQSVDVLPFTASIGLALRTLQK
jgi:type IV pilus assembly protein PilM